MGLSPLNLFQIYFSEGGRSGYGRLGMDMEINSPSKEEIFYVDSCPYKNSHQQIQGSYWHHEFG